MSEKPPAFEKFVADHFAERADHGVLDRSLRDLGLDSLDLLDFMLAIERTYDVSVDVDSVNEEHTLREILQVVTSRR